MNGSSLCSKPNANAEVNVYELFSEREYVHIYIFRAKKIYKKSLLMLRPLYLHDIGSEVCHGVFIWMILILIRHANNS